MLGIRRRRPTSGAESSPPSAPATTGPAPASAPAGVEAVRVGAPLLPRSLGRREVPLAYRRLFIPSLVIDQTEAMLRRHGHCGEEGIGLWAGTLAGGDGFVSTLILPGVAEHGRFHGELSADTIAAVLERLDELDLVPLCQIHSHPRAAFLSDTDAERPALAVPGFISVVVPSFGFVDIADIETWAAYEYLGPGRWHELDPDERGERLIVDPSLLAIG
jgi:hypothetical protein